LASKVVWVLVNTRQYQEEFEEKYLSPLASKSRNSVGRVVPEEECSLRTAFQRDRDRIIHCNAFRRLKHKTQVFISPEGDHYRTRLTHTLEVAQISRTVARALWLNEDLTEAIALGHDLGHTPFGHGGERTLDQLYPSGFRHNEQSLRVVDVLESSLGRTGLNLTWEVRDGIACHTGPKMPATLEGEIVRICDRIAYVNHDLEDAVRAGLIQPKDLPSNCNIPRGQRINAMVKDLVEYSYGKQRISMSPEVSQATASLRQFLFERVYLDAVAKVEERKVEGLLSQLYEYYVMNPETAKGHIDIEEDDPQLLAKDYIAGMTDRYALCEYQRLFLPGRWEGR
jgi:dGTPase